MDFTTIIAGVTSIRLSFAVVLAFIGLGLSLRPSAVLCGVQIEDPLRLPWQRWIGFIVMSLVVMVVDTAILYALEPIYMWAFRHPTEAASLASSEWMIGLIILIAVLIGAQEFGFIDFTHGHLRLTYRMKSLESHMIDPSWEERYVRTHAGSLLSCVVACLYMLRMPWRSHWPFVAWALWWKLIILCIHLVVLPIVIHDMVIYGVNVSDIMSINLLRQGIFMDFFTCTYITIGYLLGHILFHHGIGLTRIREGQYIGLARSAHLMLLALVLIGIITLFIALYIS